jgi:hypothetical protein
MTKEERHLRIADREQIGTGTNIRSLWGTITYSVGKPFLFLEIARHLR